MIVLFSRRAHGVAAAALALSAFAFLACSRNPSPSTMSMNASSMNSSSANSSAANAQLEQFRAATRAYQDIDAAVAAGYPKTVADCIVDEHHGAMGFHHLNRAYVDRVLDPAKPEMLLYQRMPDGSYKLNGAEFVVPYRDWPRDTVAPVFMGQTMHREDNFKYWYLHVWGWTDNPDGLFANMNPNVTCPPGTAKTYKAFPDPGV